MGAVFEDSPHLVFDFEDHVKNIILPQLGGDGIDNRTRTIVCRHWLKGLCQKGDACEYLHQMDLEKMPICKWGADCQARPNCLYRHIDDEERPDCIFYRQGFCKHGPGCRYKHMKLGPDEVPEVADFSLYQLVDGNDGEMEAMKLGDERPFNFKTSLCKHWQDTGSCPFGIKCHFAHGSDEMNKFRQEDRERQAIEAMEAVAAAAPEDTEVDFTGKTAAGGHTVTGHFTVDDPQIPAPVGLLDLSEEELSSLSKDYLPFSTEKNIKFFVLKSVNYENLAVSASHGKWIVRRFLVPALNDAFTSCDGVILFFSVVNSKQFQGIASMKSEIPILGSDAGAERDDDAGKMDLSAEFAVEWLRLCEVPFEQMADLRNPLDDNTPLIRSLDGQDVERKTGILASLVICNSDEVSLPSEGIGESLSFGSDVTALEDGAEDGGPQFLVPKGEPGYIFVTGGGHLDETLRKLIFGMPNHQAEAASTTLKPKQLCFLLDVTRRLLFGIFEVMTPLTNLIDPALNMESGKTPNPAQIRVRVVLQVPPLDIGHPKIHEILDGEQLKKRSKLTRYQVQCLATLLSRSGRGPSTPMGIHPAPRGPMMGNMMAPTPPPHRMMAPNFLPPRSFQFRKRQNHPHTLNSDGVAVGSSTPKKVKLEEEQSSIFDPSDSK